MSHSKGAQHWLMQRISAAMLVPLGLWFVYFTVVNLGVPGEEVAAQMTSPWVAALMISLILFWFLHAQLGLDEIIEDYIHQPALKLFLSMGMKVSIVLMGIFAILSVVVMV
jgi:succinate dehydrogenase / fumarate reductase membrane anchor subunit